MTTIPGHNIVIQQSGRAHDATHHLRPNQPDPQHLQTEQTVKKEVEQTTVQSTEEQTPLQTDVNARNQRRDANDREVKKKKRKKERRQQKRGKGGSDSPGSLLDTVA